MKRVNRLLKNQDFKKVLDCHNCVSRENFTIYQKSNNLGHCRVGVSVSSKIGNSVVRHRLKRQVVSMLDKCVDINSNDDIVVIVRKKYLEHTFQENFSSIISMLNKILHKGENMDEKK